MPRKGKTSSTLKQRLNGNPYALKVAEEFYKLYKAQDILTAGVIALGWLRPADREKVFAAATDADFELYWRTSDLIAQIENEPDLSKSRQKAFLGLLKYLQHLGDRGETVVTLEDSMPSESG